MKIGLVRRGYSGTGGAERYLLRFAMGLEAKGHECVLFCDRRWPEGEWFEDREQVVLKSGKSPAAFAVALEDAKPRERCDFLFSLERVWKCDCYRAGDGVHAAWLDRRARYESRWRRYARACNLKHVELRRLELALYGPKSTTHLIANAEFVKAEMVEYYGTDPDRITVIPNGFDPPVIDEERRTRFRTLGRRAYGLGPETVAFLFVGSGWERKGLRHAMAAVETLAGRGHDVRLYVAGKDRRPPKPTLRGVTEFLGPMARNELTQLYELADVFLLPTIYDPFSNACLEAASHGLPVITTRANGFAELFPEMEGASVSEPESPDLVDACEVWLDHDRLTAARPKNRAVAATYSVARNVEATLACFDRLIRQGRIANPTG
ncbi:MAG: glycosyltransferase family 4 protein [Verrucomicrobiae bacterium]|nr:glycosyltransferase family 4 protein [Verrucomicrobiae bacterium]